MAEDAILLSVIIPVYNSQRYLTGLLENIVGQLRDEIEIILVDDGSSDSSYSILCNYAERFSNFKAISQANAGAASARQRGIKESAGRFITFVDSDDIISGEYIQAIITILIDIPDQDMYVLSYQTYFSAENILPRINKNAFYSRNEYLRAVFNEEIMGEYALWNHIYSRKFIVENDITFDTESKIAEDCLFNDLCMRKVSSVYTSEYNGYTWLCDHESLTGRCPENMWETLKKHIENLEKLKEEYQINDNKYVFNIKMWAFNYILNNIEYSKYSKRYKRDYYKRALENNIDESTIIKAYGGIRRRCLLLAKRGKGILWFYIWRLSNWKYIREQLVMRLSRFVHLFGGED